MSGNVKFRWFLVAPLLVALFVVVNSPVSWAGELEDAKEDVRKYPNDPVAHILLGHAYLKLGYYQKAIVAYRETIRLHPENATARNNLGIIYGKLKQFRKAIEEYKEAIRIKPDYYKARNNLGNAYLLDGQYQEAIASSREAIRSMPDNAHAHLILGLTYYQRGQYKKAIPELKESLRIDPSNIVVRNHLNRLEKKIAASGAESLEDARKGVRQHPNDSYAHSKLGFIYMNLGRYHEAIATLIEAIRLKPDNFNAQVNLGKSYSMLGQYQDAIVPYKKAIQINPDNGYAHTELGLNYILLNRVHEAVSSLKEAIRLKPSDARAHAGLGLAFEILDRYQDAIVEYQEALRIKPNDTDTRYSLNKLEQKIAQARPSPPVNQQPPQPPEEQSPQSGSGSGFFVSKMGHVITNAHVVQNCNKVMVGDNANKQVAADIINTDRSNDLALLKLSTLEMASAESKSLIQKLGIVVVPLASKGLLRSEDVRLGERVLVAGFPFGDFFSNSIKVTTGVVSSTRGAGDDSGQFQLDAAVQPGNSGGPIYDSSGNIVGVVISQLDKLKVAKAIGSLPENVNFGIKASTVRQFLISSGLPSKKSERTEEKSTEQLAEIAQNQALMVMCLQ